MSTVERVAKHARVSARTLMRNARLWPLLRASVELVLVLGALLWIDSTYFAGDRFAGVAVHPFGVVAVLFAVQYGVTVGVLAVAVATAALYVGAPSVAAPGQDIYDLASQVLAPPTSWLFFALLFGVVRDIHRTRELHANERRRDAEGAAVELTRALDAAVKQVERLERRIAADTGTIDGLLTALSKVDVSSPRAFAATSAELLGDLSGVAGYAMYMVDAGGQLTFVAGEDEDGAAVQKDQRWVTAPNLLDRLKALPSPLLAGEGSTPECLPDGAAALVCIEGFGVMVVYRFRPGVELRRDRMQACASLMSAMWKLGAARSMRSKGLAA